MCFLYRYHQLLKTLQKPQDANDKLCLTNTRNRPLSSGLVPEVLNNQVMYDSSVEPMEHALIGQELNNDDNDSVCNDNLFSLNDEDDKEGIDSKLSPSLSVDREGTNNISVDDSPSGLNMAIVTPNAGRNVSDELMVKITLMKIMQNHSIPLVAEKELYEWAIELERLHLFSWMKGNLVQTRSTVMREIYATVPEIKGDGFEPHIIDWCSKKSFCADVPGRKQIYVWSF
eukprot:jgi/Psemu1/59494/gm1.59494_g